MYVCVCMRACVWPLVCVVGGGGMDLFGEAWHLVQGSSVEHNSNSEKMI